jgi:dihydropteroate synthase
MVNRKIRFKEQIAWDRFRLDFSGRALVMGILNVTPDSFSDGGAYFTAETAIVQGMKMVEDGADILDIGGESTRPGSGSVDPVEQIRRVVPVIKKIAAEIDIPISIDTTCCQVAQAALEAGASMVNDISGLRFDAGLAKLAARSKVPVILMHMQGTPETMQAAPAYTDVVDEVKTFLRQRIDYAVGEGIDFDKLIIDPGIGFGKRLEDNLALLARIEEFFELNRPVLVGHSRKGFIGKLTGLDAEHRDPVSLAVSTFLADRGVHLLRVHEVKNTRQACEIIFNLRKNSSSL